MSYMFDMFYMSYQAGMSYQDSMLYVLYVYARISLDIILSMFHVKHLYIASYNCIL